MEQMSPLEIGGIIGVVIILAQGLVGVTKIIVNKKMNNKPENESSGLTHEESRQLQTLHDLHCQFDENGAPKWFVPRSWGDTQKEIAQLLYDVAKSQESVVKSQESQTRILERISTKIGL